VRKPPKPLSFDAPLAEGSGGGRLVQVRDLVVAGRLALGRLDVEAGEHLLVTGPNGSGKSTLLAVLAGRLAPTSGTVSVGGRIAELAQDVVFREPGRSAAAVYADAVAGVVAPPALRDLGLVHPRDHHRPVGLLSVGQRRRLGLAVAVAQAPDLMLLDEPTNHLSPALAGEIEEALGRSPGAVIVASHDRWLRRRWTGSVRALG
jgi:macrolide transport system ATP-binding/permease protein